MLKFECVKCGSCCHSFKIEEQKDYPEFIENSNIISLSEPRLFLFDWEKKHFKDEDIVPGLSFLDTKNNNLIILNYNINKDICPNTKDNLCSIHENKPLSCWLYPCPYRDVDEVSDMHSAFGVCKAELPPEELKKILDIDNSTKEELRKKLYQRYGDDFIYGIISSMLLENYTKFVANLEKNGLIKLAKEGYPLDFLKKRLEQIDRVNVSELFYKYNNFNLHEMLLSEKGIEEIRKRLDS